MTTHTTLPLPAIGVLDIDGLHVINGSLAPITGAIRHVGDLCQGQFIFDPGTPRLRN